MMKQKAFFIIFEGLSLKQKIFFGRWEPDFEGSFLEPRDTFESLMLRHWVSRVSILFSVILVDIWK